MRTALWLAVVHLFVGGGLAPAQQAERRDRTSPELVVESGGRMGTCDFLGFTGAGQHLLAAGDDKVVRVWEFAGGKLDPKSMKVLRWPIWPEWRGHIHTMAISPDAEGRRVAIGGPGLRNSIPSVAVLDRISGEVERMSGPPVATAARVPLAPCPN